MGEAILLDIFAVVYEDNTLSIYFQYNTNLKH